MNFNRKDVLAANKGNMQAFEQIYIDINNDLYKMALYILGNSGLAKDIVSETIIDALKGIKKLKSADAFESWILKILTNKCKQKLNYKYNKFNVFNPNIKDESHMEKVESNSNIGNAEKTDVKIALSKLNTEDRMIVSLCVVEGYKSNEVAEILSMNPSTVRSRLNRSLKKMKEYLEVE